MQTYRCRILTPGSAAAAEKTLVAESRRSLRRHLEEQGHFVFDIRRADTGMGALSAFRFGGGISPKEFFVFNREFSVLIKAGMPIVAALDAIRESDPDSPLNQLLGRVREDITRGESLSGAFAKYGQIFSKLYVATLQAGEKSGDIAPAISRYLDYLKKASEIRRKVITASVYPVILTGVSAATLMFLLLYVAPVFSRSFLEAGSELPAMTRLLIGISLEAKSLFGAAAAAAAALAAGAVYAYRTEKGREILDRWKLQIPFIGELYRHYAAAKLARTLATVLRGGTPLVESIRVALSVMDNRHLEQRLSRVTRDMEKGGGFGASLRKREVMPRLALRMIDAGESGGALEQVLTDIADFYDGDVETRLTVLTSAIEPGLMILMGFLIGFIVLAMYLPIFQLAGTVS